MRVEKKEVPFVQKFDYIIKKSRLLLDFEKGKYPKDQETIDLFLNGTTSKLSTKLEDVTRDNVPHVIVQYDVAKVRRYYYSIEYVPESKFVVFHLLWLEEIKRMNEQTKYVLRELSRFIIDSNFNFFSKPHGLLMQERRNYYKNFESHAGCLTEDGKYETLSKKPFLTSNFVQFHYVNANNGTKYGFMEEIANIMPPVFNSTGNDYIAINSYENMINYIDGKSSVSCQKKSGKKQDMVDKLVSIKLPDVTIDHDSIDTHSVSDGMYKFAVIQKVPTEDGSEPICVIRTFNYVYDSCYLFEGGRIYVCGKKDVYSCKKNNSGEYVYQALLQKVKHWDFSLEKFPEAETKGTLLEYFGQIVPALCEDNRSVAIWIFLKIPFMESLVKIASIDFLDKFIDMLRDECDMDDALFKFFSFYPASVSDKKTKIFQMMGLNKYQFGEFKDLIAECAPREYVSNDRYMFTPGIIPITKDVICGDSRADISSLDNKTFDDYLSFVEELFSCLNINFKRSWYDTFIPDIIEKLTSIIKSTRKEFDTFDIRHNFPLYLEMVMGSIKNNSAYRNDRFSAFGLYRDYLFQATRLPVEDRNHYKPRFKNVEDLKTMHDNIQLTVSFKDNQRINDGIKTRFDIWEKWCFDQKEKKKKDGTVTQEELPYIVIHPTCFYDIAKEGTVLHHCVKSYAERVAEGKTNILFIRERKAPKDPFFTVEITNDGSIEQIHGFSNCNVDSEPGLIDFVETWAKKKKLRLSTINKVR